MSGWLESLGAAVGVDAAAALQQLKEQAEKIKEVCHTIQFGRAGWWWWWWWCVLVLGWTQGKGPSLSCGD
jgi:hypothetical protein